MLVEICIIYYIKINYMFRPFSLAIFRLIIEKLKTLSKQLYLTYVSLYSGKVKCGVGMRSRMLCRMGGVGYMSSVIYTALG